MRFVDNNGDRHWYEYDGDDHTRPHRANGPSCEHADGYKAWWRHGKLHRDGGPAVINADGSRFWYRNGDKVEEGPP